MNSLLMQETVPALHKTAMFLYGKSHDMELSEERRHSYSGECISVLVEAIWLMRELPHVIENDAEIYRDMAQMSLDAGAYRTAHDCAQEGLLLCRDPDVRKSLLDIRMKIRARAKLASETRVDVREGLGNPTYNSVFVSVLFLGFLSGIGVSRWLIEGIRFPNDILFGLSGVIAVAIMMVLIGRQVSGDNSG